MSGWAPFKFSDYINMKMRDYLSVDSCKDASKRAPTFRFREAFIIQTLFISQRVKLISLL